MKTIALVLLLTACTSPGPTGTQPLTSPGATSSPQGTVAQVVRVYDGDSLVVNIGSAEAEVRLIGVNAPEGSECHGDAARSRLAQLLESGDPMLVADGEDIDQYGRLLRYLYVDGLNVNLELLTRGDALVLQGDYGAEAEFIAASDTAADAHLGMWAPDACGTTPPPAGVVVADYRYNPSGRDEDNLADEWVAIANRGTEPIATTGWILRDESTQHRYVFPEFTLAAGSEVLVRSGCGEDSSTELHWCADGPVWSNGGDTVIVQLPDGTVVSRNRYSGDF